MPPSDRYGAGGDGDAMSSAVMPPAYTAAAAAAGGGGGGAPSAAGEVYLSRFPRLRRQNLRAHPFAVAVRARYGCDSRDYCCRVNHSSCARARWRTRSSYTTQRYIITVPAAAVINKISLSLFYRVHTADGTCWWDLSTDNFYPDKYLIIIYLFDYLDLQLEKWPNR